MKRKCVIFGAEDVAELAYYYFTNDSEVDVVGFSLDSAFIKEESFCGLPVVPFEEVANLYPPAEYSFFVALGYSRINEVRKEKYTAVKALGYQLCTYVSSKASVLNGEDIGENCFILEDNTIQPGVSIGNNVTLWSGNHIGHHTRISCHTFIASHVVVSGRVEIGEQCFLGVNATIRDHVKIGDRCVVGAGALLLGSAEADGLYVGAATERSKVPSSRLKKI